MNFSDLLNRIRTEQNLTREVPNFDPQNGNESAKFLFLLEAPGPNAVESGQVSFDNKDKTASNLRSQLEAAGIGREEIALWNIVPWYIGNKEDTSIRAAKESDVAVGREYLAPLISAMPNLRCIILVGAAARRAHVFLSCRTTARIVSCHHTSAKVLISNPDANQENIEVFRFVKQSV